MTVRTLSCLVLATCITGCASARDATPVDRPFFFQSIPAENQTPNNPTSWLTYPPQDMSGLPAKPATPPVSAASALPTKVVEAPLDPVPVDTAAAAISLSPAVDAPPAAPPVPLVNPADLQLNDWVVRGVRRPATGPAHAYVARTAPGAVPHEVIEGQSDQEFGLVKEIVRSADGVWIVRTEVGWISQMNPTGSP